MRRALVSLALVSFASCGGEAAQTAPPQGVASPQAAPAAPSQPDKWPFVNEDRAAQDERLAKDPGPIKSNWVPPGHSERYGHAEGIVNAPFTVVRDKIGDFAHYKDLAGPKFKSVKVVDKQGATTDVYFQLPIMKGLITIWYVTRFAPPRDVSGSSIVEGTFVKGNIKSMHIAFNARPAADPKATVLVCDLLLVPGIPAPQDAIDEELRDACGDAINSIRRTTAP